MSILTSSAKVRIVIRALMLILALATLCVMAAAQVSAKKGSQNHPPTVTLTASPNTLCYGGVIKLFADANDPDGDKLTYKYKTDVGQIIGKGRKVKWWRFGELGHHNVEVEVSDGRGGVALSSTFIVIFEACKVCPTLSMDGSVYAVRTRQLATFSLNVMGGDARFKPTYSWSVSAGKIIKGRGKLSITVDTTGVEAEDITATVKILGSSPECEIMKSLTVKNPLHRTP